MNYSDMKKFIDKNMKDEKSKEIIKHIEYKYGTPYMIGALCYQPPHSTLYDRFMNLDFSDTYVFNAGRGGNFITDFTVNFNVPANQGKISNPLNRSFSYLLTGNPAHHKPYKRFLLCFGIRANFVDDSQFNYIFKINEIYPLIPNYYLTQLQTYEYSQYVSFDYFRFIGTHDNSDNTDHYWDNDKYMNFVELVNLVCLGTNSFQNIFDISPRYKEKEKYICIEGRYLESESKIQMNLCYFLLDENNVPYNIKTYYNLDWYMTLENYYNLLEYYGYVSEEQLELDGNKIWTYTNIAIENFKTDAYSNKIFTGLKEFFKNIKY